MSQGFRLPPSERDFEVFFAVAFESASTREAAERHHISQTRVRQLVALVGDWVADHLPEWGEADLQKQVRLAQHVAANRLEHQYESAMRLWKVEGDPKHLRQATRITLAQARLGVVAGRVHALAADVNDGPLELGDELGAQTANPPGTDEPPNGNSPDRDCSPDLAFAAGESQGEADAGAASDCPQRLIEREREARQTAVRGLSLMEDRLLTLIASEGSANPEKVASLQETLSRVRGEKATAELRLSRFVPGVQIEPLEAPRMDLVELAAAAGAKS